MRERDMKKEYVVEYTHFHYEKIKRFDTLAAAKKFFHGYVVRTPGIKKGRLYTNYNKNLNLAMDLG
jgi:hypothetical protein